MEIRGGNSNSCSQKRLIIMCGLPGAGKTTTAHRIRLALEDTIVFSRDNIRNLYRRKDCFNEYSKRESRITDRIFYIAVEELLPIYTNLILDATFKESEKRWMVFTFAEKNCCQVILIECICRYPVLLQRLNRQIHSGHKKYLKPASESLTYYMKRMQAPQHQLDGVSFIQFDTEKNQIVSTSLQDHSRHFAKQIIESLRQPFDLYLIESAITNSFGESVIAEEISKSTRNLNLFWKENSTSTSPQVSLLPSAFYESRYSPDRQSKTTANT